MLITKEIEIDMGHRVPNHNSKCKNVHGHRYQIEVGVDDKVIIASGESNEGMVIDFSDLKAIMMEEIDIKFDHSYTMYEMDKYLGMFKPLIDDGLKINVVDFIPTAENLSKYWYELIEAPLKERGIKIHHVKVWETPSSTATYNPN